MRIGFPLIDVAAAFLIVIAFSGFAFEVGQPQQNALVQSYAEAERLRSEVYALFYSGALARIADMGNEEFPLEIGNITVSVAGSEYDDVYFFIFSDGGMRKFAVTAKD